MKIEFRTKEESKRDQEQAFLALSPPKNNDGKLELQKINPSDKNR